MREHFTGLIAPAYTPMSEDGSVDLATIERQAEALVADGLSAVFTCGGTGESLSLSVPERQAILERWCAVLDGELPVIAHVGHLCLPEARELAAHAQATGAEAISAVPPCYFKPRAIPDLVDWCAAIAAAAPDLPFYCYHVPQSTGVHFRMLEFLEAAKDRIPTLAGMKYTFEDMMDLRLCTAFDGGRFNILFGREEMLLSGLVVGVQGSVSTGYNFAAPLYLRIYDAFMTGDLATAQAEQTRAAWLVYTLKKMDAPWKAIMRMIGIDCGQPRLPQRRYTEEEYETVRAALEEFGFFEDCAGGGR
ncbi:dihydrodipicolinate synthase family protein [Planctomycetota bacterium]